MGGFSDGRYKVEDLTNIEYKGKVPTIGTKSSAIIKNEEELIINICEEDIKNDL